MDRRDFVRLSGAAALTTLAVPACARGDADDVAPQPEPLEHTPSGPAQPVVLFLCGDVMTGRGIDQVLPHTSDTRLYEPYVDSALTYLELAERKNGEIPRPVDFAYVWGDALAELDRRAPALRIINLETSVTDSDRAEDKGINYRMHPDNVPCLSAAKIDCCVLANNHVLDWGVEGLEQTLDSLHGAGIATAGAGRNRTEAAAPAVLGASARVLVFGFGTETSGIARHWAAADERPGVSLLDSLGAPTVAGIAARVRATKRPGDLAVASIHWGGNWGYRIEREHRLFAHRLVDHAGIDIVHGHSSHHAKGIEVYKDRLILYGCGDFLNDYEGISGHERFRADLAVMYLPTVDARAGKLIAMDMAAFQIRNFRLNRASGSDLRWLRDTLRREGAALGTDVELDGDSGLRLSWTS
jgi:poly-gamma-glutamate synthesis protein (capsule biosynthesis protein)